ncbi:sugar phosphate exchanger [Pimephales promelas]|nr:sugar phosphate exchanger [Pimephales promelas]
MIRRGVVVFPDLGPSRCAMSTMSCSFSAECGERFLNSSMTTILTFSPSCSGIPATRRFHLRLHGRITNCFADVGEATLFLGALDSIFLFSYAVGLYISGVIGDRFNLRYVLSFGLCGSAITEFIFGTLTEWLHFYNVYFYCVLWVINGLLQSTVWPCVVAIMGNWFGKSGRGFVFGLWSACASVGNILGAFLASSVLKYGYEYAFLVTSVVQFAGGVVVFFALLTSPKEIGLSDPSETGLRSVTRDSDSQRPLMSDDEDELCEEYSSIQQQEEEPEPQPKAIGFLQAFCLPGVLPYSLAYACLKLVNYSFFFWLPFYLSNNFGWKEVQADRLSVWYDVGGIVASSIWEPHDLSLEQDPNPAGPRCLSLFPREEEQARA